MDSDERDSDHPDRSTTTVIQEHGAQPWPDPLPDDAKPLVEVVGGPLDGERCRVSKASFTIGRNETNDLALHLDPMVSSRHAQIVREGQRYWLEDLGSSNGTFVGEEKLEGPTPIGPGMLFRLGQTQLEFFIL